jgi:hypothetical protein
VKAKGKKKTISRHIANSHIKRYIKSRFLNIEFSEEEELLQGRRFGQRVVYWSFVGSLGERVGTGVSPVSGGGLASGSS